MNFYLNVFSLSSLHFLQNGIPPFFKSFNHTLLIDTGVIDQDPRGFLFLRKLFNSVAVHFLCFLFRLIVSKYFCCRSLQNFCDIVPASVVGNNERGITSYFILFPLTTPFIHVRRIRASRSTMYIKGCF